MSPRRQRPPGQTCGRRYLARPCSSVAGKLRLSGETGDAMGNDPMSSILLPACPTQPHAAEWLLVFPSCFSDGGLLLINCARVSQLARAGARFSLPNPLQLAAQRVSVELRLYCWCSIVSRRLVTDPHATPSSSALPTSAIGVRFHQWQLLLTAPRVFMLLPYCLSRQQLPRCGPSLNSFFEGRYGCLPPHRVPSGRRRSCGAHDPDTIDRR